MRKMLSLLVVSGIFAPRPGELRHQPQIGTVEEHVYHFRCECSPKRISEQCERLEEMLQLVDEKMLELALIKLDGHNVDLIVRKSCKTSNLSDQQRVNIVFNNISRTSPELIAQIGDKDGLCLTTRQEITEFFLYHMSHAQVDKVYTMHIFGDQGEAPVEIQNTHVIQLEVRGFVDSYAMIAIILDAQPYFTLRNRHPLVHLYDEKGV